MKICSARCQWRPRGWDVLLSALLALLGCGPSMEEARDAWQRAHPDAYVFEYQRTCVCPGSGTWWRITVRQDSVVAVQVVDSGTVHEPLDPLGLSHPTLSQLFDGIAAFSLRPHTWTKVRYDRQWHFPSSASGSLTDRYDSRWSFEVRNFHALQ